MLKQTFITSISLLLLGLAIFARFGLTLVKSRLKASNTPGN